MWERLRPGLGETIYGAVRTPAQWRLLVSEEEFQKGNFPRLGLFDDGIFASKSHLGTFGTMTREAAGWKAPWIREEELSFLETLGKRLPIGGEAVSPESAGLSEGWGCAGEKVMAELRTLSTSEAFYKLRLPKDEAVPQMNPHNVQETFLFQAIQ